MIIHPDADVAGRERREVLIHGDKSLSDIPLKLVTLEGTTKRLSVDARPLALARVEGRHGGRTGGRAVGRIPPRAAADTLAVSGPLLRRPRYFSAVIRSTPPTYGRSTSGISTLPSARW